MSNLFFLWSRGTFSNRRLWSTRSSGGGLLSEISIHKELKEEEKVSSIHQERSEQHQFRSITKATS